MRALPRPLALALLLGGCSTVSKESALAPRDSASPALPGEPVASELAPREAAVVAAQDAVEKAERAAGEERRACQGWPLWQRYAEHYLSEDGRIVDHTGDGRSTSEGQSYALFFALAADDRARFDKLLDWTEANLAAGDLAARLPAWHWGRRDDGSYGVIDPNAASDADLWLAYTLLEAARIWREPRHRALGLALARRIAASEVAQVRGLGHVLLPGPQGFADKEGKVRLNPSYLFPVLLQRLAREDAAGPWKAVAASSAAVLSGSAPRGLAPDWIGYVPGSGFRDDAESGPFGSYDAIRVYLWSALAPQTAPHARALRQSANGLHALIERIGRVPERIAVRTAEVSASDGPPGFLAVATAYAHARGDRALADELAERLAQRLQGGLYGQPPAYYDQNLALFALGFVEGRYRFDADGHLLLPRNEVVCSSQ